MMWIEKLSNENPCPQAWQDKGENGYPRSELGYFRCDYDGYRWWNTVWPINSSLGTPELITEFDSVYDAFLKAFPTREAMRKYCLAHAEPTSEGTEFNAYLTMEHGFYWLRMITRKGDYNLYLHCISKAALAGHEGDQDTERSE